MNIIFIVAFSKSYFLVMHTKNMENVKGVCVVGDIEQISQKNNTESYIVSINELNGKKLFWKTKIRATVKNNKSLNVGDKVSILGTAKKVAYTKNEGCFDYKKYLYSKEIYLIIDVDNIRKEKIGSKNYFIKFIDYIRLNIKEIFYKYLPEKNAEICTALVLGEKNNLDDNTLNSFSEAGLSHIIAISGMHTVYVAYIGLIFKKLIGKRKSYILVIIILFLFCNITNNTESVYRATIMLSLFYLSKILFRKSDSISNLFISIILGLIKNPFCIYSPGFILSTAGTFGIITMYEQYNKNDNKVKSYIVNQIKLGVSANIILIPIIAKMYNKVSIIFLLSSVIINFFMTILMPIVFSYSVMGIFNNILPSFIFKVTGLVVKLVTSVLLGLAEFFKNFSSLNFQVTTPTLLTIVTYYLIVFLVYRLKKDDTGNYKKDKYKKNLKRIIIIYLCVTLIIRFFMSFDRSMKIFFVDVGQGDCTVIRTPNNKIILIDGGGSEDGNNDIVGEKIVVPFLLNKHIKSIDYIIISHFDSDHVGGILTVMEKIKVKNVIISKQGEDSFNYRKFKEIAKRKKINIIWAKQGKRINIEKNVYFDILWPGDKYISENILNNNSIVCKLSYNNFSMLFTGDIEAVAEEQLVEFYRNSNILKANSLKAAHHGSKTSSSKDFLNMVSPKYIFIGVGINNKFGHPSLEIIESYEKINASIYRTDQDGEITINVDNKGKIAIKKQEK